MKQSISVAIIFILFTIPAQAQQLSRPDKSFLNYQVGSVSLRTDTTDTTKSIDPNPSAPSLPDPKNVLYKSLMIPGWGQVVNNQIWKVPIVYALIGGLAGYSIYLTKRYHDYRAAFYNQSPAIEGDDQRFGPTPAYLKGVNVSSLQDRRDYLRNRRDFIYITVGLAYGLSAIDAYVFAHLRSFDVSKNLSVRPSIRPEILAYSTPGLTLSIELFKKSN